MTNRDIENLANKILKNLSIVDPERIDLEKICILHDIKLEYKSLENNISGLYLQKDNKSFIICNKDENTKRRRFTIAHELGHHFLHNSTPLFVDKVDGGKNKIFHRNEESSTGEKIKERQANAFAAALLMPESFIDNAVFEHGGSDMDDLISNLADRFGVSTQAMSFRLANLGYSF